jgi:SAM-dependent methyltransferase
MARADREHWDATYRARADADPPAAPFLVAHVALLPAGRTLDVAAGTGRNARYLAARGHRVLAADVSSVGLRRLRAVEPRVACVQMDCDQPAIRRGSCDAVVVVSFLDRRLLAAAVDWLRPGGVLLWDTFLREQASIGRPRNPDWLLLPGELRASLAARCEVLVEREGLVEEPGGLAYRSGIVARRRV